MWLVSLLDESTGNAQSSCLIGWWFPCAKHIEVALSVICGGQFLASSQINTNAENPY